MKRTAIFVISGFILAATSFCLFLNTNIASAETTSSTASGQALEIAPPVINLTADPGQTITAQISLRDISTSSLIVSNEINDFIAQGETGNPKILLEGDEVSPYSLKGWINPLGSLTLKPKEIRSIPITIKVPADAAPGGYYGVIRFTGTPPDLDGTGVSLSASLGSLILLRVNGAATENMDLKEFSLNVSNKTGTFFESTPINFVVRLENTGNVHEQPVGKATITDMFNNKIAIVNINLQKRNVLPKSIRKFTETLDSRTIGNKILFGRYKADLTITYGTGSKIITDSITFWVIPYRLIALAIAALVGGFLVLRTLIRRYNSHIIKKSQRKTKK